VGPRVRLKIPQPERRPTGRGWEALPPPGRQPTKWGWYSRGGGGPGGTLLGVGSKGGDRAPQRATATWRCPNKGPGRGAGIRLWAERVVLEKRWVRNLAGCKPGVHRREMNWGLTQATTDKSKKSGWSGLGNHSKTHSAEQFGS